MSLSPKNQASPFAACVECKCSALRRASRAVTQHYEISFRGTGLRATQFTVLAALAQTGPLPLSALAAMLGLERTSLTRNLRPLEKKGFVASAANDDHRVRLIEITPAGERTALAALSAWQLAQATVDGVVEATLGQGVLDKMLHGGGHNGTGDKGHKGGKRGAA